MSDAEHTGLAASGRSLEILRAHQWRPGQSGNPLGKGGVFAARVRRATNQGRDVLQFLLAVMRDEHEATKNRLRAAELLLERGFGRVKVTDITEVPTDDPAAARLNFLRTLSGEQLATLLELLRQAQARTVEAT